MSDVAAKVILSIAGMILLGLTAFVAVDVWRTEGRTDLRRRAARLKLLKQVMPDASFADAAGRGQGTRARGHLRGRAVDAGWSGRPGTAADPRTEIKASMHDLPFTMNLRPQTERDENHLARKLAVDIIVDDAAFDDAYLVEGAPEAVVRAVLDAPIRARLLAIHPAEIVTREGAIQLAKREWIDSPGKVEEAADLVVTLADAIELECARRLETAIEDARGAGYRGAPAGDAAGRALASAAREVAVVKAVQKERAVARWAVPLRVLLVVLAVCGIVIAYVQLLHTCARTGH